MRQKGQDALVALVTAYADGLTDDEAFTRALGQDLAAFQAGWLATSGASEPTQYGPQPAPAGPLPSGWTGPATTPGAAGPSATPVRHERDRVASGGDVPRRPTSSSSTEVPSYTPVLLVLAIVVVLVVVVLAHRAAPRPERLRGDVRGTRPRHPDLAGHARRRAARARAS